MAQKNKQDPIRQLFSARLGMPSTEDKLADAWNEMEEGVRTVKEPMEEGRA